MLSLLSFTCSVVCLLPQAYSNKFRLAALEATVSCRFVPWSAAERNGHIYASPRRYIKAMPHRKSVQQRLFVIK